MAIQDKLFLPEKEFVETLYREQRRTERSRRPFVFLLLEMRNVPKSESMRNLADQIAKLLSTGIRETDVRGWHRDGSAIGVIFTEINQPDARAVGEMLVGKIRQLLESKMTPSQMSNFALSFWVFPEDWSNDSHSAPGGLYAGRPASSRMSDVFKRSIDVCGSLAGLVIGSPVFLLMAAAVKLSSNGPIFFQQQRVGLHGRTFSFLKFRSMCVNNNPEIHKEYVKSLIAGNAAAEKESGGKKSVYKLKNDPRVTSVGRFLRKTSLDELPQFLNVLKGEMSLVGPRPPIPYEVESYDIWHRRRLLEVKPGITGLWQVSGRSRTTFDEMVRLDLQYAKSWSIWMDLRILLQTPRAVVSGDGAC